MLTKIKTMRKTRSSLCNKIYDEAKSISKLFRIITNVFGVTKEQMLSRSRKREFVESKTMFAVIARTKLLLSTVEIGDLINRDHSSIIHYTKVHTDLYKVDKTYKRMYNLIINSFTDKPFIADKLLTVDDKLSIAYVKIDTLQVENEQLRVALNTVKDAVLTY